MKDKLADKGKPLNVLLILFFTVLSFAAAYIAADRNLAPGVLFPLLALVLYAVFTRPSWMVYSLLGIWIASIIGIDTLFSADFPKSLLNNTLPAVIAAAVVVVIYTAFSRYRTSFQELDTRFRLLSDNLSSIEIWQRPDGSTEYISPACEQITGYTASEFMSDPDLCSRIILPEDRDKLSGMKQPSIELQPNIKKEEVRIIHRSGQIRQVEYTARRVFDKSGQHAGQRISMVDISSRKREVENLRIQYERLHTALETSEDGIWDMNVTDGETYFNPRYATLLGLKPGENRILLKDYLKLVHPDDLQKMLDAFKSHVSRQTSSYEAEYRLLTRFEKWRWVLDRGRIVTQDATGKATRMVGTHIDITERKMIQDALRQSEEKFRQLAENMSEVFWLRDKESGKFIYISPAFNVIWGRSAEEMYEDPGIFLDSIHWEDFNNAYHALRDLVTNGVIINEEYRILQPDGSVRWIFSRGYPIYDSSGNFYRLAGIAEDITDRMEIDSALRKSEKRYRDLIERQGDGVSLMDPQRNIIYMNPAGEDMFGVEHGASLNRNLHEFLDDEQYALMLEQVDNKPEKEESSFEIRITRGDQSQRSLLVTSTPRFDPNGQFIGEIAIFKDITQRKEQENKLWYLGLHDSLTELFNRAHFDIEVERLETSESFPIGVIMMDVDNLKQVNDLLGHATGDDMLLRISKLLRKSVRSADIVARVGGDEFAILMPNSDENSLLQVMDRIEVNLIADNEQMDAAYSLSLSAGGSTAKEPGTLRENIENADARMYEIKNKKKQKHSSGSQVTRE